MTTDQPLHLVLPGYQNSGPAHWQSRWEATGRDFRRVHQQDWDRPDLADWVAALDRAVAAAERPVVLVAHSLGCATVAHWAAGGARPGVLGALLVAPPDLDAADVPELAGFRPVPLRPLPFPAVVVHGSDDPWCSAERAREFAAAWGAPAVDLGPYGHLNSESGLGDWPEGRRLLAELTERALASRAR
ncbi:RBBP9/YdeN family alpha/beta hydrolase [Kitasatospora sp. NPDC059571]|uniref:RBBP9/YdeN family alpha/beta hydrolase n=1 Tax=Kitasatospora sp. NPDC059571 TaxID=3346871 RepID=UPI0036D070DD